MDIRYLERTGKPKLAYRYTPPGDKGASMPLVMFCGGYRSDMEGTKATYLEEQCQKRGQAYLRFDYSGHGSSEGRFEDGTIGSWSADAMDVLDHVITGSGRQVLLVGSSMGGWVALLIALRRSGLIKGMVGIAAAPDFTEVIYKSLSQDQKYELQQNGETSVPNDYSDEPYIFTKAFYEEAKDNLVLKKKHQIDFPVRLIQGMQDKDVVWQTAVDIQNNFEGHMVDIAFVEEGDHRLSRPQDLELIDREIAALSR